MTGPLDKGLHITTFSSLAAIERKSQFLSINEFAELLRSTRAATKQELPLFSCCSFGSKRTSKKSLRHDNNMRECFGVVGDYDNEHTTLDEAADALRKVNIAALIATTPGHAPERPRWRVIAPLSDPLHHERANATGFELAEYHKLVSRLAGIFPETLAPESWARAQSWYAGGLEDSTTHQVLALDGDCIDTRPDLDSTARPRPSPRTKVRPKRGISHIRATPIPLPQLPGLEGAQIPDEALPLDIQAALSAITLGEASHDALVSLAGKLAAQAVPEGTVIALLTYAADQRPAERRDAGWKRLRADIPRTVTWANEKAAEPAPITTQPASSGNGAAPPPPPPPPGAAPGGPSGAPPQQQPQPGTAARGFMRSRNPKYVGNLANVVTALSIRPELAGCVAFDEMAGGTVLRQPLPGQPANFAAPRPWHDHDTTHLQDWLQCTCGMTRVGREAVYDGVDAVARAAAFHPVRDYLESLAWDGTPRLTAWLTTYLSVAPSDYAAATGRMFLIGMVARINKPGCKADHMLVLEGPQGIYKSQVCVALASPWVSDQSLDIRGDARAASQHLRGKWLIEVSELSFFKQADVENLKAFISRTHERYLPRYARSEVNEPRQCSFIGTTNNATYLHDATGGRRFWPQLTDRIDIRALMRDRDQLWAEAVTAYRAGEHWWPDPAFEARVISPEQEARYDADGWTPLVDAYLVNKQQVTLIDVFRQALADPYDPTRAELPPERFDRRAQVRVREILQNLGWQRGLRNGSSRWWVKPP